MHVYVSLMYVIQRNYVVILAQLTDEKMRLREIIDLTEILQHLYD